VLNPLDGLISQTAGTKKKGETSPDLNEARDDGVLGWHWHRLDHMQAICTLLQTDIHTNISSSLLNFYRPVALPDAQPTVSER